MTPQDGDLVRRGDHWYAVFYFDADDCENVAHMMPTNDGWTDDLFAAAEKLRKLAEPSADE